GKAKERKKKWTGFFPPDLPLKPYNGVVSSFRFAPEILYIISNRRLGISYYHYGSFGCFKHRT
ncbi:hypothetical protein MKW98_008332, partial [Papaver atlanticum]